MQQDILYRYLFQNRSIRGEFVRINQSLELALNTHDYPKLVQNLLGELFAATALLTAMLKFEGSISVQIQGDGPLYLVAVNGNEKLELRAVARYKEEIIDNLSFLELLGNAVLMITITPTQGKQYQGIIKLEYQDLAANLSKYFFESEQLLTQVILHSGTFDNRPIATGILLQIIPDTDDAANDFEHLAHLTGTVKEQELYELPVEELLYRLYHQEQIEIFNPQHITFKCGCSEEKSLNAIKLLSNQELLAMIEENKDVALKCDYCNVNYTFAPKIFREILVERKNG